MPTYTYQPGDTGKDTYITDLAPTTNYNGTSCWCGYLSGKAPGKYRSLLSFDITNIPAGSVVTAVTFDVYVISRTTSEESMQMQRTTQAWTEAGATWNKYDGTTDWTNAGGDVSTPEFGFLGPAATGAFNIGTSGDSVALIQDAIDNRSGLLAMRWKAFDETSTTQLWQFADSEYTTDATRRPKLTVTFTEPAAARGRSFGVII